MVAQKLRDCENTFVEIAFVAELAAPARELMHRLGHMPKAHGVPRDDPVVEISAERRVTKRPKFIEG